jgi:hypothetical protein
LTSYGVYRITEKKCATCSFWAGVRSIECRANKPFYVNANVGSADCMAYRGRKTTAVTQCLQWQQWEKLFCVK